MSVANTYAKALFEAIAEVSASKSNQSETQVICQQLEKQMDSVITSVYASKEAQIALFSPITTAKEKVSFIREISKKANASDMLVRFLELLANKKRLSLLKAIRSEFTAVRLAAEDGILGELVLSEMINESDIDSLAKAFSKKLGKKVSFRVSVDSKLLAGIKVTVNGVTYDGSLRAKLQWLRDRFLVGLST